MVAKGGTAITDKLTVTVDSTISSGAAITGFETVALDTTAAGTGSFALTQITGATAINVASGTTAVGSLTMTKASSSQGLNFVGDKNTTANQLFDNVVQTLATDGTSDSIAITINNGGTATTKTATAGTVGIGNYEVVTLTSGDFATSTLGALTLSNTATSLTINAATDLTVGGLVGTGTTLATINAGGSAGAVNLGALGTFTGALTYTGSLGVDTLTTIAASTVLQTFNLGTGDDVITVSAAGTGIYQLNGEAGNDLFKFTEAPTADTVGVDGGAGTADSVTLAAAGAAAIFDTWANIEKFQDNTNQAVTFKVASGYADAMEITTINTTGVTTFDAVSAGSTIDLSKLTFTGAAFGAVTQLVLTNSSNGANTLTGAAAQATTINGGTGVDTITGGTGADALNGGAGADTITGGAGIDAINGGTGADNVTGAAGTDAITIGATGDTGVATAGGTTTSTTSLDVYNFSGQLADNDTIDLTGALATDANYDNLVVVAGGGNITATVTTTGVSVVMGTYNSSTNVFTSTTSGFNAALVSYASGDGTTATDSIVITGVTASTDFAITNGIITV